MFLHLTLERSNPIILLSIMALYYLDFEKPIAEIDKKIEELRNFSYLPNPRVAEEIAGLEKQLKKALSKVYGNLTRWQRTQLSRHFNRPTFLDYAERLFSNFTEFHGDRKFGDDQAIVGGIAYFQGKPVMVMGHQRGRTVKEKMARNFGMPNPEGYRKALRLMKGLFCWPMICGGEWSWLYLRDDRAPCGSFRAAGRCRASV